MHGPLRVLSVDDDPDVADLTATFLEREDDRFDVETATGAAAAMELLETSSFDCVVSDYDMPETDGIEFLRMVRETEPDLPFVLFTGKGSEEIASEAIAAGVTDYLQKGGGDQYTILANRVANAIETARAKAAARRSKERYRSLFENNPLALWEEDYSVAKSYADRIAERTDDFVGYLDDHPEELDRLMSEIEVIDVNQNAVEYYGADSKEQLIQNMDALMTDTAREVNKRLWKSVAEGETRFREETLTRMFDGSLRNELLELYVPEQYADDYSRLYIAVTDVTEHRERQRELQRQNERLDEFVGIVSHDLRGPLSRATGQLELAQAACDRGDLEAAIDRLQEVEATHSRMDALIEDLLSLAREQRTDVSLESVGLAPTARGSFRHASSSQATLTVETDRAVIADEMRLEQLFENLFRNAVEHGSTSPRSQVREDAVEHGSTSPRSGTPGDAVEHGSTSPRSETPGDAVEHGGNTVTVRVGETDDGFYVADDGPGIDPDDRDRIFEPGYTTSESGTGFGLSIVTAIAEAHDWSIAVTESEEGGARFEFGGVEFSDEASTGDAIVDRT